jgi:uncharacterized protein (TIGR02453 family)
MGKAYFTPELFQFLKQIKRNNRRPWFLKNRDRYEEAVRQPCVRFLTDFAFRLREISPWMVANAKPNGGSLMRIYRDIRFSADKSPYKTYVGMNFPHASATEEVHGAGYFLQLEPGASFLALVPGIRIGGPSQRFEMQSLGTRTNGKKRNGD